MRHAPRPRHRARKISKGAAGRLDHHLPLRRQADARAPLKQFEPNDPLDLGDADAQLRLAEPKDLCGAPEMLFAGQHFEQLQVAGAKVHIKIRMSLYLIYGF